jgi:DNA-binding response OmpR family regulator
MSYKVVAIDDEADILRLIRIKLEKEGFEVVTAHNGEEGVLTILKEKPDIIIVDIMMPKKNGYQVITEVKEKMGKNTPVTLLLSAKAESNDITKGLMIGADDYITKPFSPRELIERMNVALIKRGKKPVGFKK